MFTKLTYNCYETLIGLLTCDVELFRGKVEWFKDAAEWLYLQFQSGFFEGGI